MKALALALSGVARQNQTDARKSGSPDGDCHNVCLHEVVTRLGREVVVI